MRIRFIRDNKSNKKKKMKEYLYIKNITKRKNNIIIHKNNKKKEHGRNLYKNLPNDKK